ncbi:Phosphoserine aminotransferase, partial [Operophtera brumata]
VYEIIRNELTNFEDSGISLLETSHRTPKYMNLNTEVQNVVRRLLDVPANYKILFIAGGGLGAWSAKAAKEAKKYGKVNLVIPPTDTHVDVPRHIYIMGRVLQWIEQKGGLDAMEQLADKKASLVYNTIEQSAGFYYAPVAKRVRSKMNIPFRIGNPGNDALEKEFLKVTVEEVQALTKYMTEFYKKHSK